MDHTYQPSLAGWIVGLAAILNIILMLLHPTGHDSGGMPELIHGMLQFIILLQFAAILFLVRSMGLSFLAMTAITFLGVGQLAGILAATINGFVAPELAIYAQGKIAGDVATFAWVFNQSLAQLGVIAVGISFAAFGAAFWAKGWSVPAIAGLVAGLLPLGLIVSGVIEMDLHGAQFAYITQAIFMVVLGWTLARNSRAPEAG